MNIVLSHSGADFDAFASMILAAKLYPETTPVWSGSVDRSVREFHNLFADSFPVARSRDIKRRDIDTLIIVDCTDPRRLGGFKDFAVSGEARIHLYDHHPPEQTDESVHGLHPEVFVCEEVGATTTMLLERLDEDVPLNSNEATLFALGIYQETGCLAYSNTTVRDVECVARLLRHGAHLDVVSSYVNRSLTPEQRHLLDQLVLRAEYHELRGLPVCVASAAADTYVGETAVLASKLMDIQNVAVVVLLVEHSGSVLVVGRSRLDVVDLAAVMKSLGGGGHHRAASAVLADTDLEAARPRVIAALEQHSVQLASAASIMSHPVRTVTPETTVADAARVMLRYGHSGLLVVDDSGETVGIVTRKDVDGAQHHRLSHAPVKCCMTHEVTTASSDTSVLELESVMANSAVGRLPVVEDGKLVGIVTRTDILKALYNFATPWHRQTFRAAAQTDPANLTERLREQLGLETLALLRRLGELGEECGTPCYLVGGSVRDVLLGSKNVDLDLLVENDALRLAKRAAERLGGVLRTHDRFGTAGLKLPDDRQLDFATARTEFYEHAAALPEVEFSSLREDLYRRDFTINTMAVELAPERFGRLLDYFGGERDLRDGVLRVLHNLSFVEDPTRMFRAVRFEQRFGLALDPQTEALIVAARDPEALAALSPERLRNEIILLLKEPDPLPALHRLAHLELLTEIDSALQFDEDILHHLETTQRVLAWGREALPREPLLAWPLYFWPLFAEASPVTVRSVCERLRFRTEATGLLVAAQELARALGATLSAPRPLADSTLRDLLFDIPFGVQLAALSLKDTELGRARVEHFYNRLREARPDISGDDLKARGLTPGPLFSKALSNALRAKLDDNAPKDEQLRLALATFPEGAGSDATD